GFGRLAPIGLLLMACGFVVISQVEVELNYWLFATGLVLFAAGMALAGTPATTAITASLPPSKQGVASAVNDTAREPPPPPPPPPPRFRPASKAAPPPSTTPPASSAAPSASPSSAASSTSSTAMPW